MKPSDKRYSKHLKQLKTNGFSDAETWSLYSPIAQFILPRLIRFREISMSYPGGLTSDEWNKMVDKMIFAFEWALNDEEEKYNALTVEERENNWRRYEDGMQLFAKWFRDLWW